MIHTVMYMKANQVYILEFDDVEPKERILLYLSLWY